MIKRLLFALIFVFCASPAHAVWTCQQGGPGCTNTTVRTCNGAGITSCSITVLSTHAGAAEAMCENANGSSDNMTVSTTDGTWVAATASFVGDAGANLHTKCEYNLNATGGATTITCIVSSSSTLDCEFFEFTGTGSSFTFDKAANVDDAACTTCSGANLGSLGTSNNYILVQSAATQQSVTAINQSYNIAVNATTGNGSAYKMNVSSAGTTPNWTNSASGILVGGAIAIYEIVSGSTPRHKGSIF